MNLNHVRYYSRKDVQSEILRLAKDREVQGWFNEILGSRPDVLNYIGDVDARINNGLSSIHVSEERWFDPLNLKPGMKKSDLDNLRKGWDFVIDLDSKHLPYGLMAGELVVDALRFHDIKNVSIKFSGNHGIHIGICYEAFPKEINGQNIKDFFPDGLKIMVSYLKDMIKEPLSERLLKENIEDIAKKINKNKEDLIKNKEFDPFEVVDIDTILISSRHMFRAAYSINEKSGLVSIPLKSIKDFKVEDAKPENVRIDLSIKFLDRDKTIEGEARQLLVQALDWINKKGSIVLDEKDYKKKEFQLPNEALKIDFFPPCILKLISGIEDGKKRGVFILVNYLQSVGWKIEDIELFLKEWNKKNNDALKDNYLVSQINWFKSNKRIVLPPNCENMAYYKSMLICKPDGLCNMIKNPVQYSMRKKQAFDESQPKKRGRKPKNEEKT